ncbi:MAG: bifunctional enoyl-CoA hydratase/phosphate acetyltransferase [Chitinophagales bacterium]
MPITSFSGILEAARSHGPVTIAVAAAEDVHTLEAVRLAGENGLARALLAGRRERIAELAGEVGLDLSSHAIVEADLPETAARLAAEAVFAGQAQLLMKGSLSTAALLKAALACEKERDGRARRLLSHVAVFEIPGHRKLLFLTDAGMIIAPTLDEKVELIANARQVAAALGVERPKVAVLAAVETVNPKMPSTIEAFELVELHKSGRIPGVILDGPVSFDIAVDAASAAYKGVQSPVAGDADILLVHDIDVGNPLGKSLIYFGGAKMAGVVAGGSYPIVLTSRSETPEGKLVSIALAVLYGRFTCR